MVGARSDVEEEAFLFILASLTFLGAGHGDKLKYVMPMVANGYGDGPRVPQVLNLMDCFGIESHGLEWI